MFWKKNRNKAEEKKISCLPEGVRVYAIGDIHGYADLLDKMHNKIKEDAASFDEGRRVIVYMGDYIDRGYKSKEVIETLVNNPMADFEKIYILGNHEDAMMKFMENPEMAESWLAWGGESTLLSYGVSSRNEKGRASLQEIAKQLNEKLPENHRSFLNNLQLSYIEGDYIFVHAGLRPGVEIDKQSRDDMLTIRNEFLESDKRFNKTVVFGHTIFPEPFAKNGRIAVDTGAYAHGNLTCAVLESDNVRFLKVSIRE